MRIAVAAALVLSSAALAQNTRRTVAELAPGVHVILHRDASGDWPQGNTLVVIGDHAVLVVDATYLPSASREDIATIRQLTNRPVRYLVNTHWHYDHNNGNGEYARAFPGLAIVAHRETKRIMDVNNPGYFQAQTDTSLRHEFASATYAGPNVTFESSWSVDLGNREVVVRNVGRGNTPGDAFVWLPKERVLATGDLVVSPVPFAFNSYPFHWIETLRTLRGYPAALVVPGHGAPQRDFGYVDRVIALLEDAVAQASDLGRRRVPLDSAVKLVSLEKHRAAFVRGDARMNEWFDALVGALPERAYREARGVY